MIRAEAQREGEEAEPLPLPPYPNRPRDPREATIAEEPDDRSCPFNAGVH